MDPPTELSLAAGEEATVPLAGAGSVGYGWTWDVTGDPAAVEVTLRAEPPPGAREGGLHGGSSPQVLVVAGRHPGQASIQLRLVRSFQPDRPPREAHVIEVTVTSGASRK